MASSLNILASFASLIHEGRDPELEHGLGKASSLPVNDENAHPKGYSSSSSLATSRYPHGKVLSESNYSRAPYPSGTSFKHHHPSLQRVAGTSMSKSPRKVSMTWQDRQEANRSPVPTTTGGGAHNKISSALRRAVLAHHPSKDNKRIAQGAAAFAGAPSYPVKQQQHPQQHQGGNKAKHMRRFDVQKQHAAQYSQEYRLRPLSHREYQVIRQWQKTDGSNFGALAKLLPARSKHFIKQAIGYVNSARNRQRSEMEFARRANAAREAAKNKKSTPRHHLDSVDEVVKKRKAPVPATEEEQPVDNRPILDPFGLMTHKKRKTSHDSLLKAVAQQQHILAKAQHAVKPSKYVVSDSDAAKGLKKRKSTKRRNDNENDDADCEESGPNKKRKRNQRWTPDEDEALRLSVGQHGLGNNQWKEISTAVPGRSNKQCQERWCNHLDPSVHKGPLTAAEGYILQQIHEQYQDFPISMTFVKLLPGRTAIFARNNWHNMLRKKARMNKVV